MLNYVYLPPYNVIIVKRFTLYHPIRRYFCLKLKNYLYSPDDGHSKSFIGAIIYPKTGFGRGPEPLK